MSYLLVNGIELNIPLSPEASFQDLIVFLRKNLTSESALISSVKVNGNEVNEPDEEKLATVPISQLKSVEVLTRHPKELAQETLEDAMEFISVLMSFSKKTAERIGGPEFFGSLNQLVDGIGYFTEAIIHVKKILKIGSLEVTDALEDQLLLILKEILRAHQKGQKQHLADFLNQDLIVNLEQWRMRGLPSLIRSRDC